MSQSKESGYQIKIMLALILMTCLIFVVWLNESDDRTPNLPSIVAEIEETESGTQKPIDSFSESNVKKINDAADILSLVEGEKFSLLTEFKGERGTVILEVFNVTRNSKFTQFQSKGTDGSVSVVTLTPTMTSILLKTPNNIYEYAGNAFNGILNQVASLNLSDDIHETKSVAKPIKDNVQLKKVVE